MASKADPLKFAYVKLHFLDEEFERKNIYKVFHVDQHKIRIRSITIVNGIETEHSNLWVPWTAIHHLEELNSNG